MLNFSLSPGGGTPKPSPLHPLINPLGQECISKTLGRAFPPFCNSCKQTDYKKDFSQCFQKQLFNVCILVRQLRPAASFSLKEAKPIPPPANTVHISKYQNMHFSRLRSPNLLLPQNPSQYLKASAILRQNYTARESRNRWQSSEEQLPEPSAYHGRGLILKHKASGCPIPQGFARRGNRSLAPHATQPAHRFCKLLHQYHELLSHASLSTRNYEN